MSLSTVEAREVENAELRWVFAKTFIEPCIKDAANDDTALGLLPNHEKLIRSPSPALLIVKCRKTAHSWGIAAKAMARAATEPRSTTIIGSYDEDEAREKLNFLEWIYRVLPPGVQRSLKMSDGTEVRNFTNGSRIKFLARKAPTGAGASVEWDEFSVEMPGRVTATEILTGALACTTHTGTVSLGGTQRGAETVFNKIARGTYQAELEADPVYQSMVARLGKDAPRPRSWDVAEFPWWISPALSKDPIDAMRHAWNMTTADRVEKYGNDKLLNQYWLYSTTDTLGLEMFQREFELMILDDKESYFDLDLIESCYREAGRDYWFRHTQVDGTRYGKTMGTACLFTAKMLIDELANAIRNRVLVGEWGWAMDVGMDHDQDEIWIGHVNRKVDRDRLMPRINIGINQLQFDGKEELIHYMFQKLPLVRGYLDATKGGLGVQLAQRMFRQYGQRAAPFQFTTANKQILASGVKAKMQSHKLPLPPKTPRYNRIESQMLKIKKTVTASGNVVFDTERNKGQHGDCFWALAMLCELFTTPAVWTPRRGSAGTYNHQSSGFARRL